MTTRKHALRLARRRRVRSKVSGTKARPRVAVFRSNKAFYVQFINDEARVTLLSAKSNVNTVAAAKELGVTIAEQAKKLGIKTVVFDRAGYKYHGSVAALAESLRAGGLSL